MILGKHSRKAFQYTIIIYYQWHDDDAGIFYFFIYLEMVQKMRHAEGGKLESLYDMNFC